MVNHPPKIVSVFHRHWFIPVDLLPVTSENNTFVLVLFSFCIVKKCVICLSAMCQVMENLCCQMGSSFSLLFLFFFNSLLQLSSYHLGVRNQYFGVKDQYVDVLVKKIRFEVNVKWNEQPTKWCWKHLVIPLSNRL